MEKKLMLIHKQLNIINQIIVRFVSPIEYQVNIFYNRAVINGSTGAIEQRTHELCVPNETVKFPD